MTFTEMPPQERMMFIAKIYHNIWYDESRFFVLNEILKSWDDNPVKEAKFLHEINNDKNNQDGI
jgi:hypothetical protein